MSLPAQPSPPCEGAALDDETRRAEGILFDIAADLRRAPLAGSLRLHLRALELKRMLVRWRDEPPDEASRAAVLRDLCALQRDLSALLRGSAAGIVMRSRVA